MWGVGWGTDKRRTRRCVRRATVACQRAGARRGAPSTRPPCLSVPLRPRCPHVTPPSPVGGKGSRTAGEGERTTGAHITAKGEGRRHLATHRAPLPLQRIVKARRDQRWRATRKRGREESGRDLTPSSKLIGHPGLCRLRPHVFGVRGGGGVCLRWPQVSRVGRDGGLLPTVPTRHPPSSGRERRAAAPAPPLSLASIPLRPCFARLSVCRGASASLFFCVLLFRLGIFLSLHCFGIVMEEKTHAHILAHTAEHR